eukprot:sb/3474017/
MQLCPNLYASLAHLNRLGLPSFGIPHLLQVVDPSTKPLNNSLFQVIDPSTKPLNNSPLLFQVIDPRTKPLNNSPFQVVDPSTKPLNNSSTASTDEGIWTGNESAPSSEEKIDDVSSCLTSCDLDEVEPSGGDDILCNEFSGKL